MVREECKMGRVRERERLQIMRGVVGEESEVRSEKV